LAGQAWKNFLIGHFQWIIICKICGKKIWFIMSENERIRFCSFWEKKSEGK